MVSGGGGDGHAKNDRSDDNKKQTTNEKSRMRSHLGHLDHLHAAASALIRRRRRRRCIGGRRRRRRRRLVRRHPQHGRHDVIIEGTPRVRCRRRRRPMTTIGGGRGVDRGGPGRGGQVAKYVVGGRHRSRRTRRRRRRRDGGVAPAPAPPPARAAGDATHRHYGFQSRYGLRDADDAAAASATTPDRRPRRRRRRRRRLPFSMLLRSSHGGGGRGRWGDVLGRRRRRRRRRRWRRRDFCDVAVALVDGAGGKGHGNGGHGEYYFRLSLLSFMGGREMRSALVGFPFKSFFSLSQSYLVRHSHVPLHHSFLVVYKFQIVCFSCRVS